MSDICELKKLAEGFRVLYVEDEAELRKSILLYLKKIFTYIDAAKNGKDGLELYQKNSYDIVISDILMPKMDGIEMCKRIKEINDEQEIIIVSAYSESRYFLQAIELGVNGYIIKPINYKQFNDTLFRSVQKLSRFKENLLYRENLEELIKERTEELISLEKEKNQNYQQTLLALVEMIEDRDTYTGGHSQRVAKYSKMIAKELGYSKDNCDLIYQAGILHDVGKIATPDTVLLKPGKLNQLEYTLIKEHVTVGYDFLHKVSMYDKISEIMRYHHERYDGKGYPTGASKDQIPKLAHVMIIADSFDAMTTNRIYKSRKTIHKAIEEIKELSGKQFDPEVAEAAIDVFKKLHKIESTSQIPSTKLEQERFSYYYRDQLTLSYNRYYLDFVLNHNREHKEYNTADILYLHNFSKYNQKFGWSKGDEFLHDISISLANEFKDIFIFRVHGDDFLLLSKNEIHIDIDRLNSFEFIKNKDLYFAHQRIDLLSDEIYDLKSFEDSLDDH